MGRKKKECQGRLSLPGRLLAKTKAVETASAPAHFERTMETTQKILCERIFFHKVTESERLT